MRKPLFTGVCTAMVTPFLDGQINYPLMEVLLQRQIDAGIQAVVICGTTGEGPTLTDEEKIELIRRCKQYTAGRMIIIAGTGSNSTAHTIALSIAAQESGADALLIVSPYYNKATEDGLAAHYTAIARNVSIPIIVYNVPSRTGQDIPVSVYRRLSRIPQIAGVKEAGSIEKVLQARTQCPKEFSVWTGNDTLTAAAMSLGALGVISVASNLIPEKMQAIALAALDGDFDTAADIQCSTYPLINLLSCEVNPIPIKAAMKMSGIDCGSCRLPLTDLSTENAQKLKQYL